MDDRVAWVLCRQMGWSVGYLIHRTNVKNGPNSRIIWMDNMGCVGTETHVEQCTHADSGKWQWATENCSHSKDIGVGCDMWTSDGGAVPWSTRHTPTASPNEMSLLSPHANAPTTTKENA